MVIEIFSFPNNDFCPSKINFMFQFTFNLSSINDFILNLYSIHTHFAHQQQTAFENIVGKEEIAHNEQFLLFPQCFLLN